MKKLLIFIVILVAIYFVWEAIAKNTASSPNKVPAPMDILAPGYNKSQEKIKQIEDRRQQALDAQREEYKTIHEFSDK